ncbi:8419_t:CDS:2 [Scutellospora calospora]|uniref:8419_t:CDS:1 n=1 Tax=Scutellospora calospora TaxID=85575 RepID=A0ACA9KWE9_9GLOM|nr:8419_t:CDS:2 [Scutellospora calospora]
MLPPPPTTYNNPDELFQNVQRFAISQGYVLLYATRCDGLWHLEVRNAAHNHNHSEEIAGHPIAHRLSEQQTASIAAMTTASLRPKEIISTLRQNDPSTLVTNINIYNTRVQIRLQNLAGRTPIQTLIDEFQKGNFLYEYKYDNTVGITGFNTTFYSCFIFMKSEDEEDYKWALTQFMHLFNRISKPGIIVTDRELALMNALNSVFPDSKNLLCNNIVQSETEIEFDTNWNNFHFTYINKSNIISYLEETWIPWKERGKVLTFALKKINDQYQKAKYATTLEPLPPCTGSFSRTMGYLPVPQIEDNTSYSEDSLQLFLQDLQQRYQEWPEFQQSVAREILKNMIEMPLITLQNPNVVRTKRRPPGAPNRQTNSTKRDLSGFELVDYKVRHCTLCLQPGHNARTCSNNSV